MASVTANVPNVLEDERVRFVRITWVDYINFVRYRVLPIGHFRKLVAHSDSDSQNHNSNNVLDRKFEETKFNPHGGITIVRCALGLVYLTLAEGFGATGEILYKPDLATTRWLPYAPGTVNVFGYFEEKQVEASESSPPNKEEDGKLFELPLCPRTILDHIADEAKKDEGVSFLVGFETEVVFLSSIEPIKAVNDYSWSVSSAISAGTPEEKALQEIAEHLETAGIELQMYHAESAPGQFEFVTGPLPPREACDALVTTREIIVNVASKHGMRATLAPRVFADDCGSAAHTHISLSSTSKFWSQSQTSSPQPVRVSSAPGVALTPLQSSFLAGLLEHLPSTVVFTLPTRASYARMIDGFWTGGTWVSWGRDNRETPVRLAGRGGAGGYNFEIKSVDGTANPYLAISSLLVAGLSGVRERRKLTSTGLHIPAALLSEEKRREYGSTKRMPLDLEQARKALVDDEVMRSALGEEFVQTYLNVNKTLDDQLKASTPEEEMVKLIKAY